MGLDPSPGLAALHRAILGQDPNLAARAAPNNETSAPPRPVTNLPTPLTELIGRDEAVTEVRSLVLGERLVTLTGSGGVGKTRLALEAARPLVDTFADGVWLVELAAQNPAFDPAELVMTMLDIRETAGSSGPMAVSARLGAALHGRHLLLVLDNCEHVVDRVVALVARVLPSAPNVRILATSREPLGLAGELVWDVPALDLPADGSDGDLALLARFSAVQLFVARGCWSRWPPTASTGCG